MIIVLKIIKITVSVASAAPEEIITSKTNRASIAPIGSFTIPSHFNIEFTCPFGFTNLKRGIITVGPVTTKIAPSKREILKLRLAK